ncbi:MAG: GNAT family N-acetyltransferase, partial [Xanthobacteraceae bacterium]
MTSEPGILLRAYQTDDEDASVALWLRTWQATYPALDFTKRLDWWRERWRKELLPVAEVVIAEANGSMIGFVTIDTATRYLDQLVVAPEYWGAGVGLDLIAEAKRLSPS